MNIRLYNNQTVLHQLLCLFRPKSDMCQIDEIVKVLLECEVNPNDEDNNGDRALHYAVKYDRGLKTEDLLLQFGAHYDATNHDGNTYRSLVAKRGRITFITADKYITLQRLAAIAIIKFQIPFKSRIPRHLEAFVNFYSVKKTEKKVVHERAVSLCGTL